MHVCLPSRECRVPDFGDVLSPPPTAHRAAFLLPHSFCPAPRARNRACASLLFPLVLLFPSPRIVRVAGPGQPQGKALSGEEEIVQNLLEGINTVAYPKSFVKRKAPKVSRAEAGAAVSAAAGRNRHLP